MRYLSVCSGIEAATQAWHPLGWRPIAFSEIEPFPSAVLAHHYPTVPNWGDMTRFAEWPDAAVDLLVGGTPCQSFSVAGLRKGLRDPRGNLALVYLALADRYRPDWLVWENVPGVLSSNGGRDFGAFLGGLGELGYGFAYRVLDSQYVRTRRFGRAVPQRRRRVFVVGYLGDWRRAAAVLFDRESLLGNSPPSREAGQGIAATLTRGAESGGKGGYAGRRREDDSNIVVSHDPACTLTAREFKGALPEADLSTVVDHALRGEGFDASEDGTGRGTPLVPIAFDCKAGANTNFAIGDVPGSLRGEGHGGGHAAVAFQERGRPGGRTVETQEEVAYALLSPNNGGRTQELRIATPWAVRRLTPTECERLQGFPDGFTRIPVRRYARKRVTLLRPEDRWEPAVDGRWWLMAADGPRYRALGNSMAVNAMEWIGERIALVDGIARAVA